MGDLSRRSGRAFAVPTLKMRGLQVPGFAVCRGAPPGAVSAVIIARSARAGDWSNAVSRAFTPSASFYEGKGLIEKARLLLLEGLGERFPKIGIIIDVMTDIAGQANLLTLNGAIEASSREVTAIRREQKISTEDVARPSQGLAELAFQLSDLIQGFKLLAAGLLLLKGIVQA